MSGTGGPILTTLRAAAFATVIVGALFKIQHWPGAHMLQLVAWVLSLVVLVARPVMTGAIVSREAARDLFTFGLLSAIVMRTLHLPDHGFALGAMVVGGLALLWYDRGRFLPGNSDASAKPWLFYTALVLVLVGTLFRIQHWPYSTLLLISGLVLCGVWFFWSMRDEKNT